MQFGEGEYILRAQYRMVAAASFRNIVEQRGDQDQFRMGKPRPEIDA
ncbi:Uncharacterised protein [Salmonella enterica subsp. enterica serovar Bovismorbificans]|uniref:Uncharacterized protein n=1 Tax=Salmonella enterica subsp. enterica serovar Bovismorbificans TaxID=58097 RepID=A0A655DGX6_SALET|nr:Uncharacterised protein [Salmonella enterica subsp. enterica serovar Bovismorbificans]CPR69317.1 Uncharacterised protein [Salmonella enterica subsp. enterica serovar Bovismorbificans]